MYRRLSLGFTGFANRLSALSPNTLMAGRDAHLPLGDLDSIRLDAESVCAIVVPAAGEHRQACHSSSHRCQA